MKLQKNYGCGVHHKICGYQLHTFLKNKILRQTVFLKTSMRLLSGNWARTCLKCMFGNLTLDLFASRINHQIGKYISWKLDHKAIAIDAFSIKFYYIFPHFSLLGKVTAKIYRDKTKAIVVIPKWPMQHWCASLLRKATRNMIIIPLA